MTVECNSVSGWGRCVGLGAVETVVQASDQSSHTEPLFTVGEKERPLSRETSRTYYKVDKRWARVAFPSRRNDISDRR